MLLWFLAVIALCQSNPERIQFEVASIKPIPIRLHVPIEPGTVGALVTDGYVDLRGMTLRTIISRAYRIPPAQVIGLGQLKYNFDIHAKIPLGQGRDQVPEMLQALLQDRFGMSSHVEIRQVNGFTIVISKPERLLTHRLQDTASVSNRPPNGIERPVRLDISLQYLRNPLTDLLKAPVIIEMPSSSIDATNRYVFWLETSAGYDSIKDSLKECGLELTRKVVEAQYIIVNRIHELPTEN